MSIESDFFYQSWLENAKEYEKYIIVPTDTSDWGDDCIITGYWVYDEERGGMRYEEPDYDGPVYAMFVRRPSGQIDMQTAEGIYYNVRPSPVRGKTCENE